MCWSTWSIRTGSSKARRRIRPPRCRSCRGARPIPPFRTAAISSTDRRATSALGRDRPRANPRVRPGIGIAIANQVHELLRDLFVAAAAVGALLRHRARFSGDLPFQAVLMVDPQVGKAAARKTSNDWLSGFAGGGLANISVAIA